ncbi:MAG: DUF2286 domain-containing protein [Desulfurococcales archaeon]|nr:DUF2286 domain-containing protein [Desulfurococcales archaeon]
MHRLVIVIILNPVDPTHASTGYEGMTRITVIRGEYGKVTESRIVDSELEDVVKEVARSALNEWSPNESDFIVIKDLREIDLKLPLKPEIVDVLRKYGTLSRAGDKAIAVIPVFTISFDNKMISEDKYIENKVYIIAPYINDEVNTLLESLAAEITAEEEAAPGITEE